LDIYAPNNLHEKSYLINNMRAWSLVFL